MTSSEGKSSAEGEVQEPLVHSLCERSPFLYANSQCFFLFLFVLSKKILMDVASMLAAHTAVTSTLNYCNVFFLESSVSR